MNESNCRICLDHVIESKTYCLCRGHVGTVHLECLKKWICENNYNIQCEICHSEYNLIMKTTLIHFNNIMKFIGIMVINCTYIVIIWIILPFYNSRVSYTSDYIFTMSLINIYIIYNSYKFLATLKTITYIIKEKDDSELAALI